MRIPWRLPQCGYPGCKNRVWKRTEIHCKDHYWELLYKIARVNEKKWQS